MSMKKKKRKKRNVRREIAKRLYKDPTKVTFQNKSKALIEAGYSKNYANTDGERILDDIDYNDADYARFETFIADIPQISSLVKKKLQELATSDSISAKDYSNLLRHIEILAKALGVLKQVVEKREQIIKIDMPQAIVEAEYKHLQKRRREKEDNNDGDKQERMGET